MASKKLSQSELLAAFFDDGSYTALFSDGAVQAAYGCAGGQPVYAVCQNGAALTAKDLQKNCKVLDMAQQTGNPVVTFYDSVGAKLEEGLDVLTATSALNARIAQISGVVPQIAVVVGVCGASAALAAASADLCIMASEGELFFTPAFTAAANGDKTANTGTAQFAAKAGVAALVADDAAQAAALAARMVATLPGNNLAGPALYDFAAPTATLNTAKYDAAAAVTAVVDADSALELYAGFGKKVYTAFATVNGSAVGVIATETAGLCSSCVAKVARMVRLCDAFSVPVVTLVNSDGFVKSAADDVAGGIRQAARLAATYADATTAKVAVVTGKAIGPVYSALANADLTIALNGCTIAALEPTAAVSVLYKEEIDASDNILAATNAKAAEYAAKECSAAAAVAAGAADMLADAQTLRASLVAALDMLASKRAARLPKKHGNMAL